METAINREEVYLGIKNDHGAIEPLIGKKTESGVFDFVTGNTWSEVGDRYASVEGFPSCPLNHILEAWGFDETLTREELKDLETLFANPTSIQIVKKHMGKNQLQELQEELWMLEHVALIAANSKERVVEVKKQRLYQEMMRNASEQQETSCTHTKQPILRKHFPQTKKEF